MYIKTITRLVKTKGMIFLKYFLEYFTKKINKNIKIDPYEINETNL